MNKRFIVCSFLLAGGFFLRGSSIRPVFAGSDISGYDTAPSAEVAEEVWAQLMAGNRRWIRGTPLEINIPALRHQLAAGTNPKAIVLACSDPRVAPEHVFDQPIGQMYVLRTVAHVVGPMALGTVEYAVTQFKTPVLIIMGHDRCGAVEAACDLRKSNAADLQAVVDRINENIKPLRGHYTGEELKDKAIRLNMEQTGKDLLARSPFIREAVQKKQLTLIYALYHMDSGQVERLAPEAK